MLTIDGAVGGRFLLPAVSLISASALAYEILLMRLLSITYWHHFAYMIISLALLGYGTSGTLLALYRRQLGEHFSVAFSISAGAFGITAMGCYGISRLLPFNALEVIWDPGQWLWLAALYGLFFVPFLFAATAVGLALTHFSQRAGTVYLADLLGAGIGAFGLLAALFVLDPANCLKLIAVAPVLAAALTTPGRTRAAWLAPAAVLALMPTAWLNAPVSPYKGLSQAMQVVGARVIHETSSPLGLLTVVENPRIPFRHAPGASLATPHIPPEQLAVFTDGDGMNVITDGSADTAFLDYLTSALPYHLLQSPSVAVLGAGAGLDVLMARHHQARRVLAVELNPDVVDLVVERFRPFAGNVYASVQLEISEARGHMARTGDRFDLIQVSLLDSFATSSAGTQALSESYLYTTDALSSYLDRLTPGGMLAITRWLKLPPRDSLKLFATAIESLTQAGADDPASRLAMIRSWNTVTLLVSRRPFSGEQAAAVRSFAESRSFDLVYLPGIDAAEVNRFNVLARPYFYQGTQALLSDRREEFVEAYKYRIEPATDNRPYFFNFFKWSTLPELVTLRSRGGAGLLEWSYLILVMILVQAIFLGSLLILAPLAGTRKAWRNRHSWRLGAFFFAIGVAFLFVEIAFIQKFILFLSHPLYAISVVLSGFLISAGLGSGWTARWTDMVGLVRRLRLACCAIVALSISYVVLLPLIFSQLMGLPDAARIVIALLLIAPLGFFMGMPFPLGLRQTRHSSPDFLPWAWGLNGLASVLSAVIATLLAIEFGFNLVVGLAAAFYLSAALLLRSPSKLA